MANGCSHTHSACGGDTLTAAQIRQLLAQKADSKKVIELINSLLDQIGAGDDPPISMTLDFAKGENIIAHNKGTIDVIASFYLGNHLLLIDYYPLNKDSIFINAKNAYEDVRVIIN